jgi:hypothetical protein
MYSNLSFSHASRMLAPSPPSAYSKRSGAEEVEVGWAQAEESSTAIKTNPVMW